MGLSQTRNEISSLDGLFFTIETEKLIPQGNTISRFRTKSMPYIFL